MSPKIVHFSQVLDANENPLIEENKGAPCALTGTLLGVIYGI